MDALSVMDALGLSTTERTHARTERFAILGAVLAGLFIAVAGLLLAHAVAGPVSANTTGRFSFDDVIVDTSSCGVVLTTQVHGDVTAHIANDGTWLVSQIKIRYAGVAVDPATGRTLHLPARQNVMERPDAIATSGQGIFIRVPGQGVLLLDVGHLVFDPTDGSTINASAHVIAFDDPTLEARIDEALCSLFD
jgi:hypothetical protein